MIHYDRTPYRATGRHGSRVQAANHRRRTGWQRAKNDMRNREYAVGRYIPWGWTSYDIDGNPISMFQGALLLDDIEYRRIGLDMIGDFEVSTVHMPDGIQRTGDGRPLIFETMVFDKTGEPVSKWMTTTKELAKQQHEWVCHRVRQEVRGICPHSGETFRACKAADLCDCFDYPEHEHYRQPEVGD